MLHGITDEATAAGGQAYAAYYSTPMHAGEQSSSTDPQVPSYTASAGIQNSPENYAYAPRLAYPINDEVASLDFLPQSYVDPSLQQCQQYPLQQPSFMRRPYRYQKRNSKTRLPSKPTDTVAQAMRHGGEASQWVHHTSYHTHKDISTKGSSYFCNTGANQYASLYQDSFSTPIDPRSLSGAAATTHPKVLSPPMESSAEIAAPRISDDQLEGKTNAVSGFLPSPDSNCPSPAEEHVSSRGSGFAGHPRGVTKKRSRRSLRRKVRNKNNPDAVNVSLTSEEQTALENIFERQFDTMCRAVMNEFNTNHETQIGVDLVLKLVQQTDLRTFSTF